VKTTRRAFIATTAAAVPGCCWPSSKPVPVKRVVDKTGASATAELLATASPKDLLTGLAAQLKGGMTTDTLARELARFALKHTYVEAASPSGMVSHAFLSVIPALRISRLLPEARRAIPLLVVARTLAEEAARSPYGPVPFTLDPLPNPTAGPDPLPLLKQAIDDDAIHAAEQHLSRLLSEGKVTDCAALIGIASTREFGHVGHGAIFAAHALAMLELGVGADAIRAPLRYITSFRTPDETLTASSASAPSDRELVDRAAQLVMRMEGVAGFPHELHALTGVDGVVEISRFLDKAGRDGDETRRRASAWLDFVEAGTTELGSPTLAEAPPAAVPLSPKPADAIQLLWELDDPRVLFGAIRTYIDRDHPIAPLQEYLVESACAASRYTLGHSIKVADATLGQDAHRGSWSSRWATIGVNAWAACALSVPDPLYGEVAAVLDLSPHPAVEI